MICRGVLTVAFLYPWADQAGRRRYKQNWMQAILAWLGVKLEVRTPTSWSGDITPGILLVSNHISWLDIVVLNSWQQFSFLAKSEVRQIPMIGWLAEKNETLFISRGRRSGLNTITQQMDVALQKGQRVVIFPEGTTTMGGCVGHFHAALFEVACRCKYNLQPLAISYFEKSSSGQRSSTIPAYVDDDTLLQSMWAISRCSGLHARIEVAETISGGDCQQVSRRELANLTWQRISKLLPVTQEK